MGVYNPIIFMRRRDWETMFPSGKGVVGQPRSKCRNRQINLEGSVIMENENLGIGVLTLPLSSASRTPLSNLLEVLHGLSNSVYVITGNEGYNLVKNDGRFWIYGVNYKTEKNVLLKVLRYLSGQIKLSIQLVWIARNTRVWFFFGGEKSLIPMLILKLLRKKTVLAIAGSSTKDAKFTHDPCLIPIQILSFVNCSLSDYIILYSRNLISEWNFEKYRHKILIAHEHFLDFETFTVTTPCPIARPSSATSAG